MKKTILLHLILFISCAALKSQDNIFTKNFEKKEFAQINDSLFAAKFELSNQWYSKFLNDVKINNSGILANVFPDTAQWAKLSNICEPFAEYYHKQQAYQKYPVVNISYDAVVLFCNWLTEKYNQWNGRIFAKVQFRLPTEQEWLYAAKGNSNMHYTWPGPYLLDRSGQRNCNFKYIGDEKISYDVEKNVFILVLDSFEKIENFSTITTKVEAYTPNEFGIYQMCGNAGEMIAEPGKYKGGHWNSPGYDVRLDRTGYFTSPCPFVGFRLFMEIKNN